MDIVLNTIITDDSIPSIPMPGFADDFERADAATLGLTSGEGKAWQVLAQPGSVYTQGITSGAGFFYVSSGNASAVVDAETGDGVFEFVVDNFVSSIGGLVLRASAWNNFLRLGLRYGASNLTYTFFNNTGSSAGDVLQTTTVASHIGDVVRVILSGATVTLFVNGVQAAQFTDAAHTGTLFGIYGTAATNALRIERASFIPA